MKKLFKYAALGLLSASCATVPMSGRKQLSLVSDAQIQQEAAAAYTALLRSPETKVVSKTSDAALVEKVGKRIAAAVNEYLASEGLAAQYAFKWEFSLIESPEINAWCMPGGKVAIYTGILPVTANESGMATVMGHEIAHAVARHSAERISNALLAQMIGAAANAATEGAKQGLREAVNRTYGVGSQLYLLGHSRGNESEADKLGLMFMAMAGYDPNAAVPFWERMAAAKGANAGAQPEFLSTHPSDARRIRDIQQLIPEAMKYYK